MAYQKKKSRAYNHDHHSFKRSRRFNYNNHDTPSQFMGSNFNSFENTEYLNMELQNQHPWTYDGHFEHSRHPASYNSGFQDYYNSSVNNKPCLSKKNPQSWQNTSSFNYHHKLPHHNANENMTFENECSSKKFSSSYRGVKTLNKKQKNKLQNTMVYNSYSSCDASTGARMNSKYPQTSCINTIPYQTQKISKISCMEQQNTDTNEELKRNSIKEFCLPELEHSQPIQNQIIKQNNPKKFIENNLGEVQHNSDKKAFHLNSTVDCESKKLDQDINKTKSNSLNNSCDSLSNMSKKDGSSPNSVRLNKCVLKNSDLLTNHGFERIQARLNILAKRGQIPSTIQIKKMFLMPNTTESSKEEKNEDFSNQRQKKESKNNQFSEAQNFEGNFSQEKHQTEDFNSGLNDRVSTTFPDLLQSSTTLSCNSGSAQKEASSTASENNVEMNSKETSDSASKFSSIQIRSSVHENLGSKLKISNSDTHNDSRICLPNQQKLKKRNIKNKLIDLETNECEPSSSSNDLFIPNKCSSSKDDLFNNKLQINSDLNPVIVQYKTKNTKNKKKFDKVKNKPKNKKNTAVKNKMANKKSKIVCETLDKHESVKINSHSLSSAPLKDKFNTVNKTSTNHKKQNEMAIKFCQNIVDEKLKEINTEETQNNCTKSNSELGFKIKNKNVLEHVQEFITDLCSLNLDSESKILTSDDILHIVNENDGEVFLSMCKVIDEKIKSYSARLKTLEKAKSMILKLHEMLEGEKEDLGTNSNEIDVNFQGCETSESEIIKSNDSLLKNINPEVVQSELPSPNITSSKLTENIADFVTLIADGNISSDNCNVDNSCRQNEVPEFFDSIVCKEETTSYSYEKPFCDHFSFLKLFGESIKKVRIFSNFIYAAGHKIVKRFLMFGEESDIFTFNLSYDQSIMDIHVLNIAKIVCLFVIYNDGCIQQFDALTGSHLKSDMLLTSIQAVCSGWSKLFLAQNDGRIFSMAITCNVKEHKIRNDSSTVCCLATTTQGSQKLLYVASPFDITIWDTKSEYLLNMVPCSAKWNSSMELFNNLVFLSIDNILQVFNVPSNELLMKYKFSSIIALKQIENVLCCCSYNGLIQFFAPTDFGTMLLHSKWFVEDHGGLTHVANFSNYVVTSHRDGSLEIFRFHEETLQACPTDGCHDTFGRPSDLEHHLSLDH